ncbi:hypothetical protein TWF694_010320 [Orbilia ellipsospora]|uniref:Uncharacterized protein n=1 Tax=Orbilia ellipsospora TaxID=2528407 RepID=A0AAV9XCL3_9PEZI
MAATPPPKSPAMECPDAPFWPAKYEHPREVRRSTRIAAGKQSTGEPSTPGGGGSEQSTPPPTVRKDKTVARNLFGAESFQTPMKKKQGMPHTPASISQSAKAASRISKFSLDQRPDNQITIFEDTNARLPVPIGEDEDDVFKTATISKRRKTTTVQFQAPTDDGMMVVQRGRKTFKKFEEQAVFTGPMPRKNLFANYPRPVKAVAMDTFGVDTAVQPVATDDEETEREETPEPPVRNVRFLEAEPTTSVAIAQSPAKSKPKTPRRSARSTVEIETSFLTPPATLQRDHTVSFDDLDSASQRSSVKRKLSYTSPATPEATPAKKRTKGNNGAGVSRDEDVFESPRPRRVAIPKSRV